MSKINIEQIRKIIVESRKEQQWHNKFVKNFVDARFGKKTLTEQQLDEMAEHLYELLKKETS